MIWACVRVSWRQLADHWTRTGVTALGVCFAIVLIFFQFGLLDATRRAVTQFFEFFDFDLVMVSSDYQFLVSPSRFERVRNMQLRTFAEVDDIANIQLEVTRWTDLDSSLRSPMLVFGIDPKPKFLANPELRDAYAALAVGRSILIDRYSHRDYGDLSIGGRGRIWNRELSIAGHYSLGLFFYTDGSGILGNAAFNALFGRSSRYTSLSLVDLAEGTDPKLASAAMRSALPDDVTVLTREAFIEAEQDYFIDVKPMGIMFQFGFYVALIIGTIIMYHLMSTEISTHLREYATMKAIGFRSEFVYGVAIFQSLIIVLLGFSPALAISFLVFQYVETTTHLPVFVDLSMVARVILTSLAMALAANLLTLYRIRGSDPAELY